MLLTIGIGRFQKEDYYVGNNSNKNLAMKENSFNTFLLIISNISHEAFNDNAQNHSFEVKCDGERRACGVSENSNMSLLTANSSSMYKYMCVQMLLFVACLFIKLKILLANFLPTAC